ncbi:MAG TPA: hypothetical protein VKB65_05670, partial [Myxococcota bacterium]|nr:hypothetical protein [Myxococcota bacterium]
DVAEIERAETELHHLLMGGADAAEGGLAWIERRPPRFTACVGRDWPAAWPVTPRRDAKEES